MSQSQNNDTLLELISASQLSAELGVSESTLFKWVKLGKFPSPLRVGLRELRWLKKSVNEHFEKLNIESIDDAKK